MSFRISIIGLAWMISGCGALKYEDESLTLKREEYHGSEFRLDGYYYHEFQSSTPRASIYFFYRNGTVLFGSAPTLSELSGMEEEYRNGQYFSKVKDRKTYWGLFKVVGDSLVHESWFNNTGTYRVAREHFQILNDSTLNLVWTEGKFGDDKTVDNEIYHFRALSPKPDSLTTVLP